MGFINTNPLIGGGSDTAEEILTKLITVDGDGSGVDADKIDGYDLSIGATPNTIVLRNSAGQIVDAIVSSDSDTVDGQHASEFATAAQGILATNALPAATYTANDILTKLKTVDGMGSLLDADLLDGYNASIGATPYTIVLRDSEGNINADTVDGQHAAEFAATGHNHDTTYVNVTGDTMTSTLTIPVLISTTPTGAAPFVIASETMVENLNADMVDGCDATAFALTGHTHDFDANFVNTAGDIMTGNLTVPVLISSTPTGTAPIQVASTTRVENLNADLLDGNEATAFSLTGHTHDFDANFVNTTGDTMTGTLTAPTFISTTPTGTMPFTVTSETMVENLNVEMLNGYTSSQVQGFNANIDQYYEQNTKLIDCPIAANYSYATATPTADNTNVKLGTTALKIIAASNASTDWTCDKLSIAPSLSLLTFNNYSTSSATDYINVVVYISDVNALNTGLYFAFDNSTNLSNTNGYSTTVNPAGLVTGWNFIKLLRSDFTIYGSGTWSNIQSIRCSWNSQANSLNEYVTFNLLQLVRKDPALSIPNPFQINNIIDFNINYGEWFIGLEGTELICRDLLPDTTIRYNAILGTKLFDNFIAVLDSEVKTATASSGLVFYIDASNYICAYISSDTLNFRKRIGIVIEEYSSNFPIVATDKLRYVITKSGTKANLDVYINNTLTTTSSMEMDYALLTEGYLGLYSTSAVYQNIESLSITTINEAFHATKADIAANSMLLNGFTSDEFIKTITGGAGSGIDADKLDGQHAAFFATAVQGTKADNALPTASYTAIDVIAKVKTLDGSGSLLDADLVDGMDTNVGSTPNTIVVRDSSGNINLNSLTVVSTTMVENLNADLLDGNEANAFATAAHTHANTNIAEVFISTTPTDAAPFIVTSLTKVTNLNSDLLDGYEAAAFSLTGHTHNLDAAYVNVEGDTMTGALTAPTFISTTPIGNMPFVVTSTTLVENLNADMLDGNEATAFSLTGHTHDFDTSFVNVSGDTMTGNLTVPVIISTTPIGTAPFQVTSTTLVSNLNADLLDGNEAAAFATSGHTHNYDSSYVNVTGDSMTGGLIAPIFTSTTPTGTSPFVVTSETMVENLNVDLLDGYEASAFGLYHGVYSRPVGVSNPLPVNITSTTFTLGATANPIVYYYQGSRINVTSDKTATLTEGAGLYFIYFNGVTGNIAASKTHPGLTTTSNVILATVFWNNTDYGLVSDERHIYTRNCDWHEWAHDTIGCRYQSGVTLTHNGGTGAGATFATTAGEIHDEDIAFAVPASSAFPSANTCRLWWQTSASTYTFDKTASTVPFKIGVNNRPVYIKASDYSIVQMTTATNRFINFFVYVTIGLHTPIYIFTESVSDTVAGTNGYSSLANARAVPFPNLSSSGLSPELKAIYRLIVRADGLLQAIDLVQDDYRTVTSLPMAAGNTSSTAAGISYSPTAPWTTSTVQTTLDYIQTDLALKLNTATAETSYVNVTGDTMTGNLTVPIIVSSTPTGTAPLQVASTTLVNNLNADLLDGNEANAFATSEHTHNYDASYVNVTGDTMTGNLSISATAGSNPMLSLTDADVAHGMTDLSTSTDTAVQLRTTSSAGGGAWLRGLSDAGTISGAYVQGIIGAEDPTDTVPAIIIDGSKKNGTGYQAMGAAETALKVQTGLSTNLVTVLGNGDTTIAGSVTAPIIISSTPTGTAPLTVTSTTMVENLNADMLDGFDASQIQGFNMDIEQYYQNNTGDSVYFTNSTFTSIAGTQSADSTNVKVGTETLKILCPNNTADNWYSDKLNISLKFNEFNDGSASATSDYIYFVVYISDVDAIDASINLMLDTSTNLAASAQLSRTINKTTFSFVTGWNFLKLAKSAFDATGDATWASTFQSMRILWNSTTSKQNAYVSFNFMQLVRKDPSSNIPNPFQRNINGTWTRDFAINDGEWYVGLENSKVICRNICSADASSIDLIGTHAYVDFILDFDTVQQNTVNTGIIGMYQSSSMRITCQLSASGYLYIIENDGSPHQSTVATTQTLAVGDKIRFRIIKSGTKFHCEIYKNNITIPIANLAITLSYFNTTTPSYIILGDDGVTKKVNFDSLSITTTEHTHHSSIAEVAKSLSTDVRDTDALLTANSDVIVSSQKAVKTLATNMKGFNLPVDEYYLHNTKLIDDGTSVWVDKRWDNDAACTYSIDTTNYLLNSKSVRGTGAAGGSGIHLVKTLNLNLFNDGSTSGTTDYIYVVLYCADSTKLGAGTNAYTLILANDAFGTTTNCLYYSITKASIATGWNFISIAKSAFGVAGTGTFASITGVSLDFAVAPTESTYFSIQVMQLIRKDPLGSRPWLFQTNVNGTMTNDFTYDSGQMYIGYEYSKLICKNLSSAASATIISAATYTDFIGDIVFRTTNATVSYIQWLYDGNNYLQVGLYGGNVEWILKQAGVTTTGNKAFTVVSGDVIDLRFSKKGTVIEIIVRKNNDDTTLISLNMTTTITTAGYIRPVLNDTTYLESFNFTTTEHAYHSSVSELAKDIVAVNRYTPISQLDKEITRTEGFNANFEQYYQNNTKMIDLCTNAHYTSSAGTQSADSTNYKVQEPLNTGALKILENDNTANSLYSSYVLPSVLDLTKFADGSASTTSDYIYFVFYVSDATKVNVTATNGIYLRLSTADASEAFQYSVLDIVTGWNYVKILKSAFTDLNGGMTWNLVGKIGLVGWESTADAVNAYVSFNLIQLVRKDPSTAVPNPFQRCVNNIWTRDFTIVTGEWFVGLELEEVVCRNLAPTTTAVRALYGSIGYADCNMHVRTKIKVGTTDWYAFSWAIDATNGVMVVLDGTDAILQQRVADSASQLNTNPFTFAVNDIIDIYFTKNGQSIYFEVWKNGQFATSVSGNTTLSATAIGYLAMRSNSAATRYNIEALSITSTEHAYHSSVAEVAKEVENKWKAWTPTLTWTTATPTSPTQTARYTTMGNTCFFNYSMASTDGNGATALDISLPVTPKDNNGKIALTAIQKQNTTCYNPLAWIDDDGTGIINFINFTTCTSGQAVEFLVTGQYEI